MKKLHNILLLSLAVALSLTACTKDDETELTAEDTQAVLSETGIDAIFEDVDNIGYSALVSTGTFNGRQESNSSILDDCGIITADLATRTIVVDFGSEGCVDMLGRMRLGKIILTHTADSWVMHFDGFKIDDMAIEGERIVDILNRAEDGSYTMNIQLNNGKIIWDDGSFITREIDRTKIWRMAEGEWEISGSASGTNRLGQEYNSTITSPLLYLRSCMEASTSIPVKGVMVIERPNPEKEAITVDFGDGTCDNLIEVTVGDFTKEVEVGAGA